MKFMTALGLATAALVLAGSAGAQDHGGNRGEYPQTPAFGGPDSQLPWYSNAPAQDAYREKVKAYNMACTPDRRTLCKGRSSASTAWECIRIRRSKLTEPCREATYAVERAAADANYSVF